MAQHGSCNLDEFKTLLISDMFGDKSSGPLVSLHFIGADVDIAELGD